MKTLLNDPIIKSIVINQDINQDDNQRKVQFAASSMVNELPEPGKEVPKDIFEYYDKMDQDDETLTSKKAKVFLLEIDKNKIEDLQKRYYLAANLSEKPKFY